MKIAITGTPGTGKTSISSLFDGYRVIHLTEFVKEKGLGEENDEFEVDIGKTVEQLKKEVYDEEDVVIEGHLSHHYPVDYCLVLRCEPSELKKRLKDRDYSDSKVQENVESEALDVILSEANVKQEEIIEVDTTDKTVEETFKEVKKRVEKGDTGFGDVDWSSYF